MIKTKPAKTDYPILPIISNRWSPIIFSDKAIKKEKVMSLLEAARWAPSSYNEQPWQYIIGYKGDKIHNKLSATLTDGNIWAKNAPVLMCSVARNFFNHEHKPNRHHLHDTGMATMALVLQATEMDLITHQMSGFDAEKIRSTFNLGEGFEPGSMIAIGYSGNSEYATDDMKKRDSAPRQRKNLNDLIFNNKNYE